MRKGSRIPHIHTPLVGRVAEREDKLWRKKRRMASRGKFATGRQSAYIVHLENLTGMRSQGPAGNRIRLLRREAQRQKIPDYKWKPLPVKKTKDPSIVQPSRRRRIIDRSTRVLHGARSRRQGEAVSTERCPNRRYTAMRRARRSPKKRESRSPKRYGSGHGSYGYKYRIAGPRFPVKTYSMNEAPDTSSFSSASADRDPGVEPKSDERYLHPSPIRQLETHHTRQMSGQKSKGHRKGHRVQV